MMKKQLATKMTSNFILTSEESAGLSRDQSTLRRPSDKNVIISNEQNASISRNLPTFVQHVENSMISGNCEERSNASQKALKLTERPAVLDENIHILNVQLTDSLEPISPLQVPNILQSTLLSEREPHFTVNLREQSCKYIPE